jgi:hypothetical protein
MVNKSFHCLSQAGHLRTSKRIAPAMIKPSSSDLNTKHHMDDPDDGLSDTRSKSKGLLLTMTHSLTNGNEDDDEDYDEDEENSRRFVHKSMSSFSFMSFKKKQTPTKSISTNMIKKMEPIVHYNGSYHTLEQLPDEKWQWIKRPSLAESQQGLQNPLATCSTSIVFRKPHRPL